MWVYPTKLIKYINSSLFIIFSDINKVKYNIGTNENITNFILSIFLFINLSPNNSFLGIKYFKSSFINPGITVKKTSDIKVQSKNDVFNPIKKESSNGNTKIKKIKYGEIPNKFEIIRVMIK